LPWLAVHPVGEWVGERLGLGKRPFHWFYRPVLWPAWNPAYQRVARVWTAGDGVDAAALDALGTGGFDGVVVAEPTATEAREQFGVTGTATGALSTDNLKDPRTISGGRRRACARSRPRSAQAGDEVTRRGTRPLLQDDRVGGAPPRRASILRRFRAMDRGLFGSSVGSRLSLTGTSGIGPGVTTGHRVSAQPTRYAAAALRRPGVPARAAVSRWEPP
jgi:hypothetical protein